MSEAAIGYPDDYEPYRPPATTPEGREAQLVNQAYDLAEQQMRDGNASAQVISHFLKVGSMRERLEQELIGAKVEMEKAKVEALAAEARVEELYTEAIAAMRSYAGQDDPDESDEPYED